jgi:hypothetical protein
MTNGNIIASSSELDALFSSPSVRIVSHKELSLSLLLDIAYMIDLEDSFSKKDTSLSSYYPESENKINTSNILYDPIEDIEICCGGLSEGKVPILCTDSAAGEKVLHAAVSDKILSFVEVKLSWIVNAIRKRPEFCNDTYPALSENVIATVARIVVVIDELTASSNSELDMVSW